MSTVRFSANEAESMVGGNSALPCPHITKPGPNEPIQILLFPPKNKQFTIDEKSNRIALEPVSTENIGDQPVAHEVQCVPLQCKENENTTLTPSLEKCHFYYTKSKEDRSDFGSNYSADSCVNRKSCDRNTQEILQIESVYKNSKLGHDCFLKGCKWSPDGCCLLTNSNDNILRLFEFPQEIFNKQKSIDLVNPILQMREGGTVYDHAWYPLMNSCNPATCVFASCSQDSPIHLWDAYTGNLRATYQPINQYDEVTNAYSIAFSPNGMKLYSGFKKCLRIFDISLPGRVSEERNLKSKGSSVFQTNITSAIAINPFFDSVYALGSYDKSIGLYTEPDGELQCLLKGQQGGVTHLEFSPDGTRLYSGGRKDPEILCWDLRKPGLVLMTLKRTVDTNQRIYFHLTQQGSYLATGSTNGNVDVYDTRGCSSADNSLQPIDTWRAHDDCTNGVHFHPSTSLLATCSGQRHVNTSAFQDEDSDTEESCLHRENTLKIWSHIWS